MLATYIARAHISAKTPDNCARASYLGRFSSLLIFSYKSRYCDANNESIRE